MFVLKLSGIQIIFLDKRAELLNAMLKSITTKYVYNQIFKSFNSQPIFILYPVFFCNELRYIFKSGLGKEKKKTNCMLTN